MKPFLFLQNSKFLTVFHIVNWQYFFQSFTTTKVIIFKITNKSQVPFGFPNVNRQARGPVPCNYIFKCCSSFVAPKLS